jgi:oligopeptide/dipeptide ABC transporter ATP-binding protein
MHRSLKKMSVLIKAEDIKKHFPIRGGIFEREKKVVHAVDGVNLTVKSGETLGLAGESGCGKTTLGRVILGLLKPTTGTVHYMDQDIFKSNKSEWKKLRQEMQIIFQDTSASLNPRKTVSKIVSQPYTVQGILKKEEIENKVSELLELVGLKPASLYLQRNPHEFSGGQRQRIGIARALALHPKFIVADEPVASLDVSLKVQMLNLLKELQKKFSLTYLFITHDLGVLRSIAKKVAIMYLGKIVELAEVEELFSHYMHPYTKALLSATPIPNPKRARNRQQIALKGDVPSPIDPPSGCRFNTRCQYSHPKCAKVEPELIEVKNGHFLACFQGK